MQIKTGPCNLNILLYFSMVANNLFCIYFFFRIWYDKRFRNDSKLYGKVWYIRRLDGRVLIYAGNLSYQYQVHAKIHNEAVYDISHYNVYFYKAKATKYPQIIEVKIFFF